MNPYTYSPEVQIYELKKVDLKGATVIDGFPSVGLVSSIAANYIVNALNLEQIAIMDSPYFPTISLIKNSEPCNPVRIYASQKREHDGEQIVVFISEFQPPENLIKPIARALIDWSQDERCSRIISPEGLVADIEESEEGEKQDVYGISSTEHGREILKDAGINGFEEGVITGVAGVLLNEGKKREFDVIALLAEANPDYPDARAAGNIIKTMDSMFLHINIDPQPLFAEAEKIEKEIKNINKAATANKETPHNSSMYI